MEDQQFMQLAIERRYLTPEQVERAKREQKSLSDRGIQRSLWFLVQDLGFISDQQTRELRRYISSTRVRALCIEGFTIEGRLGSGGMGDVFRAHDAKGGQVAVKLLSSKYSTHDEYARRFQREARATLRLQHPHITRSLSAGEIEGQRYLMMELVQGRSLKERIQAEGPLSEEQGIVLLLQMGGALRYAWTHGVLHRDVKPANIILAPPRDGRKEPFCAKLCDFGLAKTWQLGGDETSTFTKGDLTHSGVALGTPHYMSPEQASGEHDLDQRSDIYGLGATLYHALLGQTMYSGKSSAAIMYKQVTEALDLKPLEKRGLTAPFVALLGGMLAKDRTDRLSSWDLVLDEVARIAPALAAAVGEGSRAVAAPVVPPTTEAAPAPAPVAPPSKRRRLGFLAASLVAALVAAVGVAAIAFALMTSGGPPVLNATPATLAQQLADAGRAGQPVRIVLEPGDYVGPFAFGVAHARLALVASGPGVRLVAPPTGSEPLVRLQTGLAGFELRGVALVPGDRVAVEALSGASATLIDVRIEGACLQALAVGGAELTVRGLQARCTGPGAVVEGQGVLALVDSVLRSEGPALLVRRGDARIERSRFAAMGRGGALIDAASGRLELTTVIVEAAGADAALALDRLAAGSLTDVALLGARIGIRAIDSALPTIEGLTVEAADTALSWSGPRDPQWRWNGLRLRAPRPPEGIAGVRGDGAGARESALAAVPALAGR